MLVNDTGTPPALQDTEGDTSVEQVWTTPHTKNSPYSFSPQALLPDPGEFAPLGQREIDWLLGQGVTTTALTCPEPVRIAHGYRDDIGTFEQDPTGEKWLAFPEEQDTIFWQPKSGELATWLGRNFALGEDLVDDAGYFSLGFPLFVFADPLQWLQHGRHGIVVIQWTGIFDRLRDHNRIEVDPRIREMFDRHFKPRRLPRISALRSNGNQNDQIRTR